MLNSASRARRMALEQEVAQVAFLLGRKWPRCPRGPAPPVPRPAGPGKALLPRGPMQGLAAIRLTPRAESPVPTGGRAGVTRDNLQPPGFQGKRRKVLMGPLSPALSTATRAVTLHTHGALQPQACGVVGMCVLARQRGPSWHGTLGLWGREGRLGGAGPTHLLPGRSPSLGCARQHAVVPHVTGDVCPGHGRGSSDVRATEPCSAPAAGT